MVAVSSASILISLARGRGAPALAIAALRILLAALVVGPLAAVRCRSEIRRVAVRDVLLGAAAGLFLALHFGFWISSLDYTSVMSSVVFVSTNPLFVALASFFILRERVGRGAVVGIAVAIAGGIVVGAVDLGRAGGESIRGDMLALLGAVCASGYLLVGRTLRRRMSLTLYVAIAYTTAALVLLAVAAATGTNLVVLPGKGLLWVALLALGPQLLGHTTYNWALKYVSATLVTVTLLAEPIGATLLGIPVLGQVPAAASIVGGVLILAGIFLTARAEARATRPIPR
jgi:drug/metabolite transporter (DMT)-like permease